MGCARNPYKAPGTAACRLSPLRVGNDRKLGRHLIPGNHLGAGGGVVHGIIGGHTGQTFGAKDFAELIALEQSVLDDEIGDGFVLRQCFLRELRRGDIADDRGERGDDGDRAVDGVLDMRLVGGDAIDAVDAEGLGRAFKPRDRLEQRVGDDRFEGVELQLSAFDGHRHGDVGAGHGVRDLGHRLGDDGIDLAGHDRRSRLAGGQVDLTDAGLRPRGQQAQVVGDLRHLQRAALERTGEGDEDARVGGGFDEVASRFQVESGDLPQVLDDRFLVPDRGVDRGADGGGAHVYLAEEGDGFLEAFDVFAQGGGEGVELLTERHRHGVLELGAPDLDDVGELAALRGEGIGEEREFAEEVLQ